LLYLSGLVGLPILFCAACRMRSAMPRAGIRVVMITGDYAAPPVDRDRRDSPMAAC
jgi:hypothetical protein